MLANATQNSLQSGRSMIIVDPQCPQCCWEFHDQFWLVKKCTGREIFGIFTGVGDFQPYQVRCIQLAGYFGTKSLRFLSIVAPESPAKMLWQLWY